MQECLAIADLRDTLAKHREKSRSIAFVPTMGNLHEGHLSLIDIAKQQADVVVCSIFVNPLQFGPNEDLDKYPRTVDADRQKLIERGCDVLFIPTVDVMYPEGQQSQSIVSVPGVSSGHCGGSRPGHFDGVSTVVSKLFNMVQPDVAVFGQKDFQQLAVIRKMVEDLCMPIRVVGAETARDSDGLALSSRNQYLNDEERKIAPLLQQLIKQCIAEIKAGARDWPKLSQHYQTKLDEAGFCPDYFNIVSAKTLASPDVTEDQLVILAAASIGNTRLIDNVTFSLNSQDN